MRHLSGGARRLVLNLPSPGQIPERAFNELRAEYSDMQRSLDPPADFHERGVGMFLYHCTRSHTERWKRLRMQAMQVLRGLTDEEVYMRIAPMKPRLPSS